MKSLNDYIRSNPEFFNNEEPREGHFDRFDQKLEFEGKKNQLYLILRIAAVIALGFFISYVAIQERHLFTRGMDAFFVAYENKDLAEAEHFYQVQMKRYYNELEKLPFRSDAEQKEQILNELSNMDKEVLDMKRDLRHNPGNEHIMNAIINYYQIKLEMMDMVISRTQRIYNTL